jgi:MFS transporter, ACS family, hexuronate transporter
MRSKSARFGPRWSDLLRFRQTWGAIIAKAFTDPVFFFITEWFPIYLVAKGIELKSGLIAVWIPFIAADVGSFFAGWASGYLIRRGWSLGAARKAPIVYGGIGMTLLILTIFTTNLYLIAFLFAVVTFTYAGFTTMANVLPSDLFGSESVASVAGLCGTGSGHRDDHCIQADWLCLRRSPGGGHAFVRSHRDSGGCGSTGRYDSGFAASAQH